jgi:hypothetical protein
MELLHASPNLQTRIKSAASSSGIQLPAGSILFILRNFLKSNPGINSFPGLTERNPLPNEGHAQAVSLRLPTAAARVRARVRSYEICGRQSGTGAGFLRVLQFPFPIRIPPIGPQSSSSSVIWGWYNRPNSGRSTKWTQSHPTRKNKRMLPNELTFCFN